MSNCCEHGSLRRKCEICQRDEEIERLRGREKILIQELEEVKEERDAAEELLMQALDQVPNEKVHLLRRIEKHIQKMQARGEK